MSEPESKVLADSEAKSTELDESNIEETSVHLTDSWQDDGPPITDPDATILAPLAAPTVTLDRKKELLLQARASRLAWIQRVPLPYKMTPMSADDEGNADHHLSDLATTHATHKLPSISKVLSALYGIETSLESSHISSRIHSALDSLNISQADRDLAILSGNQALEEELESSTGDLSEILRHYRDFVIKLERPECANLAQGMRNFVVKLSKEPIEDLASKLRSYIDSSFEAIKSHKAWKESGTGEHVKHALESFLYGQCRDKIEASLEEELPYDAEILERLNSLQFLTPSHLEIECISGDDDVDTLLSEPVAALQSCALYHSPYFKLKRILKVYHGINVALKRALNSGTESGSKLPSADDVLPTLILTVLRARPSQLISNLRMIEIFAPSEYLRGEAGYSFTNLYSAVQFIRDLQMDEPETLSISADEFRKGLAEYRSSCEAKLSSHSRPETVLEVNTGDNEENLRIPLDVPVSEIRAARLRGEAVGVDWALKWQVDQASAASDLLPPSGESTDQEASDRGSVMDGLPAGFSRSYSFLTCRPEDIHIADLPQLLKEYRMLVHTTEQLLAEHSTRHSGERKERVSQQRKALLDAAAEIDPSLLKSKRKSSSRRGNN